MPTPIDPTAQINDFYGVLIENFADGSFAMVLGGVEYRVTIDPLSELMTVVTGDRVIEIIDLVHIRSGVGVIEDDEADIVVVNGNIVCAVALYIVSALRTYGLWAMLAAAAAAGLTGALVLAVFYAVGTEGLLIWLGSQF